VSRRVLAAPDKFRGTASAAEAAAAIAAGAREAGWQCTELPMSDGGEGMLAALGGANRSTVVTGPLGAAVDAPWRLDGARAIVEMAAASGLSLVAGANDPVAATTRGTGELIAAAIEAGAREIVVGAGGSATTDGGAGAVDVLARYAPLDGRGGPRVVVAADVTTRFADAARQFAAQKGATAAQVEELTGRLERTAAHYREQFGVDVTGEPGAGAAGGLAGGLLALGASVRPGFEVVAQTLGLDGAIRASDVVVTGEGRLDRQSLLGKVPVGVARLAAAAGVATVVVAGEIEDGFDPAAVALPAPRVASLTRRFGALEARERTLASLHILVRELLGDLGH
jgi:glycerate kinase